jgi:hypothetical protein
MANKNLELHVIIISHKYASLTFTASNLMQLWDFVNVWRDNHVLIFYTIIYYHYVEYTDELQLGDLQVAG